MFLENTKFFYESQLGLRGGKSTKSSLSHLTIIVGNDLDCNLKVNLNSSGHSKRFECASYDILLNKFNYARLWDQGLNFTRFYFS